MRLVLRGQVVMFGIGGRMNETVAQFLTRFRSQGLTGEPCSPEDVAAQERHLGLPLPAAYQAYLLIAGCYPPPALVGSDCTLGYLFHLREWAAELLQECGTAFELPTDAVVFLVHQGYQFLYFRADGSTEDPAVFYYRERRPEPVPHAARFSDWVADVAGYEERLARGETD
jgi:hypothetical protein